MSPIGGQGMNTGFADAEFLAEVLCHSDPLSLLPRLNKEIFGEISDCLELRVSPKKGR